MVDEAKNRDSDESVIDISKVFSNVKSFFKGLGSAPSEGSSDKYSGLKKAAPYIFLVLILALSIYLRTMSAYLPVTDDWAENSITGQVQANVAAAIDQQYPNIAPSDRSLLINQEIEKFKNTPQYTDQVSQASTYFKSQLQNENGQTYLVAIDPYHWYRYARNVVNNGHSGDSLKDGKPWDDLKRAPFGTPAGEEFHLFFEAYMHKFFSIFNPKLDLMTTAFYIPVLLASLAIIPAFFLAKKKGGNVAGIIAGMIVAIHPTFLTRTMGGFSDTDPYNVTLPLFIMWFFIEAFEAKNLKKGLIFTGLTVVSLLLYSVTWSGWWYIFVFLCGMIGMYLAWILALTIFKLKKPVSLLWKSSKLRQDLIIIGTFLFSVIAINMIQTKGRFISTLFSSATNVVNLKSVAQTTIWPNVLTTVAELNPASQMEMISSIGGKTVFILAFIGLLLMLKVNGKNKYLKEGSFLGGSLLYYMAVLDKPNAFSPFIFIILIALPILLKILFNLVFYSRDELKNSPLDIKYVSLILIWCMGTIFGASRGIRFVMLLMPAFALGIGVFAGLFFKSIVKFSEKSLGISKLIAAPITAVLVVFILLATPIGGEPMKNALHVARNEIPSMNDAWYESLTGIRDDSDATAIVGSWWDFGHWFRTIAERKVFFDGASQGHPAAHWMGKSLLADSEIKSLGVLRYMSCGRDNVYDNLTKHYDMDPILALELIDKIMVVNTAEAETLLDEYAVPADIKESVIEFSHCVPPDVYYITSEDMVGKGGVWGHFGSWNFERAKMYNLVHAKDFAEGTQILVEEFGKSEESAQKLYYEISTADPNQWISGWPGFVTSSSSCAKRAEDLFLCDINIPGSGQTRLVFNETSHNLGIVAGNNQYVLPTKFSYIDENGNFQIKINKDGEVPYGFSMVPNGNSYSVVMMDPLQVGSMFTRLFYHGGKDLDYFEKFSDRQGIIGGRILVWKINWEQFLTDINDVPEGYVFGSEQVDDITSSPDSSLEVVGVEYEESNTEPELESDSESNSSEV